MQRKPREQSSLSLLQLIVKGATIIVIVACTVSTAYPFVIGPLPGVGPLPSPNKCYPVVPGLCSLLDLLDSYEPVHQDITRLALQDLKYSLANPGGAPIRFLATSLEEIKDANAYTDYFQGSKELHFDDALLKQGSKRLITGKSQLLDRLKQVPTMTVAQAKDARRDFGFYLHTLQDFYSHSNYVNLSNKPNVKHGDTELSDPQIGTSPCELQGLLRTGKLSDDGKKDLLTTGYAIAPLAAAKADPGQCAHGLFGNGIHKDWLDRPDHGPARKQAEAASRQFTELIINNPLNIPDNVCMFMTGEKCSPSQEWNLAKDFRIAPTQANPNPDKFANANVWHFMQSSSPLRNPSNYSALTFFTPTGFYRSGLHMWAAGSSTDAQVNFQNPSMGVNAQADQFVISFNWPAGAFVMHPNPLQMAVVGWRSPITGSVSVTGQFKDVDSACGNGIAWFIDKETTNLAQGSLLNGGSETFNLTGEPVSEGTFLYFVVDATNLNAICDSTQLDLSIR